MKILVTIQRPFLRAAVTNLREHVRPRWWDLKGDILLKKYFNTADQ